MRLPTTREILDLQLMVEGYRSEATTYSRKLEEATYRLKQAEWVIEKQDNKIQRLHRIIGQLEIELIERDHNEGHKVA